MKNSHLSIALLLSTPSALLADDWQIQSQEDWEANKSKVENIIIKDGLATPSADTATLTSILKSYPRKRSAKSITIGQSTSWLNWKAIENVGPKTTGGAPVLFKKGPQDYWLLGTTTRVKAKEGKPRAKLEGFKIPLIATDDPHHFIAPGGANTERAGYSAWQSRDMINWVYHGAATPKKGRYATTAEFVNGKAYIYYDFPNDQDPHLVIDKDLTDGKPGKDMGMVFKDPSDGSDTAVIRDLEGKFHIIYEDWSPINASERAWDSPLAGHSVSADGIKDFKIVAPAVDERTVPTGKKGTFFHPHWYKTDPENYPGVLVPEDVPQHRIKKGDLAAQAEYEIHEPEQRAYGDWSAIAIGGQYYLFCDYDPVGATSKKDMSVAWFTSSSIDKQFTLCGNIGSGHPDPDILFANNKFYLVTQNNTDYISDGPWVGGVEVRVGVDTNNDKKINQWSEWATIKETYSDIEGVSKQIAMKPASLNLSSLPDGFGFQVEIRLNGQGKVKPEINTVTLSF